MQEKRSTPLHRILHWTIASAMTVLLITGFLRMTWMNKHVITDTIAAHAAGTDLAKDQMTAIAVAVRAPMWEWHIIFAYVMFAALLVRIVYMLAKGIRFPNPFNKALPGKQRLQGITYVLFYLFVVEQSLTGAYLHWFSDGPWKKDLEAIHKWALYWVPLFILLHFVGVAWEELKGRKGITSRMIGGE